MNKNEVQVGGVYTAKVTNRLVEVRIDGENRHGGWDATNLATGKKVRIKSAAKLRGAAAMPGRPRQADATAETPAEAGVGVPAEPAAADGDQTVADRPAAEECRAKARRTKGEAKPKKMSGLDAAAKVLEEAAGR